MRAFVSERRSDARTMHTRDQLARTPGAMALSTKGSTALSSNGGWQWWQALGGCDICCGTAMRCLTGDDTVMLTMFLHPPPQGRLFVELQSVQHRHNNLALCGDDRWSSPFV